MKDPALIKELINENVTLADVMMDYGVKFLYSPKYADEVQFHCAFHGKDTKPSARLYNTTNSCYCWVCRKSWDVVSFIMEKESLAYSKALQFIISKYRIDTSSIPDQLTLKFNPVTVSENEIQIKLLKKQVLSLKGKLSLDKYRAIIAAYYMTLVAKEHGADISESTHKIGEKISCLKSSI